MIMIKSTFLYIYLMYSNNQVGPGSMWWQGKEGGVVSVLNALSRDVEHLVKATRWLFSGKLSTDTGDQVVLEYGLHDEVTDADIP